MTDTAIENVAAPDGRYDLLRLAFYRLFISLALFSTVQFDLPPHFLADSHPDLYVKASRLYVVVAVVLLIISVKGWGEFNLQTLIQLTFDAVMITLITHASGGFQTGLGTLLLVVVIAAGALLSGWQVLLIAAIATFMVLMETVYDGVPSGGYRQVVILGATFFITAVMAQILGKRLKATQQIANRHASSANRLTILNSHIISRLQIGVIVVNKNNVIYLTNQFAQKLLGITGDINGGLLHTHAPDLVDQLEQWRQDESVTLNTFRLQPASVDILPQMIALEGGDTLIFLNDMSELIQQAHQMKLASLGRMAASIAHEIRNPLSAISHAAQLLSERRIAEEKEQKLLDIINRHSDRIDDIIESVLQLGQRKQLAKTTFSLVSWMKSFIKEFRRDQGISDQYFLLEITSLSAPANVTLIEEQLRQIMVNLCSNAWHYSKISVNDREPQAIVRMTTENGQIVIDVLDSGPGVSETALPKLFEPFYSERSEGTGLGLFLAREMAQANGLILDYIVQRQQHEGFFRLAFSA